VNKDISKIIALTAVMATPLAGAESLDQYRQGWAYQALRHQYFIDMGEPFGKISFPYTHNSYNSQAYQNLGSYHDPNHIHSLVDQLDMGVRALELDVHWTTTTSGKALLLCHGQSNHTGCSPFDRRFEDGIKEVATWLKQPVNKQEVLIVYIEEHSDGHYDEIISQMERQLGSLIYKPTACSSLPMNISKADVLNAGKQVLVIGGNCATTNWSKFAYQGSWPTDNDTFQAFPACSTARYSQGFVLSNQVRIYEDLTNLSSWFGNPSQPITPELMAEAQRCGLGVIGLDQLSIGDARMEASIWSWSPGEPNNWEDNEHCAEHWANGRFNDANCGVERRFACQDMNTGDWMITQQAGPWSDGETQCQNELGANYEFQTPKNGFANEMLRGAKRALQLESVWVNYSDRAVEGQWRTGDYPTIETPDPDDAVVWRKLRNDKGKCLDLAGRKTANGTEVHQWSCHGADSQLWWQDEAGLVRSKMNTNKCLDVSGAGTEKGARVHLWDCHGGPNQVWLRGSSNSWRISNAPNMALDIKDPFWGDGMRAHIWPFHGGKSQRWSWD